MVIYLRQIKGANATIIAKKKDWRIANPSIILSKD